ncbi:MAG TPA: lysylphosphatidylglycerol synthase domain-containing protein, partial [Gemmatimonadota bacterium]|nr:lysylphosphatidylglycerol synthase domain-containing protein [Gemmatimonadota bacterium]
MEPPHRARPGEDDAAGLDHEASGPGGVVEEAVGGGGFPVPRAALRWGITGFVVASLVGFGVLFFVSEDLGASLSAFKQFDLRWGLVCLGLASMDWFGGGVRIWVLLWPLDIEVSYWRCVEISGATAALAYLTPSGAGGGPAHLYGLVRDGVSVGRAAASNFASFLVNITFLSSAGLLAWYFGASSTIEDLRIPVAHISAARMFEWTATGFAVIVAVIIIFAINPRPLRGWVIRIFGR